MEKARERKEERARERERVKIKRGVFILKDGQKTLEYIEQEVKKSDRTTKDNLQVVWQQPIDTHTYTHTHKSISETSRPLFLLSTRCAAVTAGNFR